MTQNGKPLRRALQDRTIATRQRIVDGALAVIAQSGVAGLTHREIAACSGVSLAATTYHFATKADILAEASRFLLSSSLSSYRELAERVRQERQDGLASLDQIVRTVVISALTRERDRSMAWCEIMLHGGRSAEGRALAQHWYDEITRIMSCAARGLPQAADEPEIRTAIDMITGLTFLLQPLRLSGESLRLVLWDKVDLADHLERGCRNRGPVISADRPGHPTSGEVRDRIVDTAVDILAREGTAKVSYGEVARRLGVARSGPAYYFPKIDALLAAAQTRLFESAKSRYREGLDLEARVEFDVERLLDWTSAVFFREALEFADENLAYYSVWNSAANHEAVRPAVTASLIDLHHAWRHRIAPYVDQSDLARAALELQAVFAGQLFKSISTGSSVSQLSGARDEFKSALRWSDDRKWYIRTKSA